MDKIIEKLIEFLPLWYVVLLAIIIIAMRFYYTRFKPLEGKTQDVGTLKGDVITLKSNANTLKDDVNTLKDDVNTLKGDVNTLKGDVNTLKGDVRTLKGDVNILKGDVSTLKEKVSNIEETLESNNDMLIAISEWIMKMDTEMIGELLQKKSKKKQNTLVMKGSPYKLTEEGKKVFNEVDGSNFLDTNKEMFFSLIDKRKPKTAYDVENAAQYVLYFSTREDIFNPIKDYVYNAPSRIIKNDDGTEDRHDITLEDVCQVLSIPLRDMYLEERFKKQNH